MPQIMTTLEKISSCRPCKGGWRKVKKANGGPEADMNREFPLSSILDSNGLDDTLWVFRCLPEYNRLWLKFAVWCARQVQHLMRDDRSINALDVAWRYSEGLATDDELKTAEYESSVASMGAVRSSARHAAMYAARNSALNAASYAADAAAKGAAWRAARGTARIKAAAAKAEVLSAQQQKLRQILDAGDWVE